MKAHIVGTWIVAALFLFAPAWATEYRSVKDGSWTSPSTWEIPDPLNPGNWVTPLGGPGVYDCSEVRHAVVVDYPVIWTYRVVVQSGASLTVKPGALFYLQGASPSLYAEGGLIVQGSLWLDSTGGPPVLEIYGQQKVPCSGGEIAGYNTGHSGDTLQLRINGTAADACVYNAGTISGNLKVMGIRTGSYTASFVNGGLVTSNGAGQLWFDSSLTSIGDEAGAVWRVDVPSASAELKFSRGASTLVGTFELKQGILHISAPIATPNFVVDDGVLIVDVLSTFYFGTVTGSCSGKPASNGSLGPGVYNMCP